MSDIKVVECKCNAEYFSSKMLKTENDIFNYFYRCFNVKKKHEDLSWIKRNKNEKIFVFFFQFFFQLNLYLCQRKAKAILKFQKENIWDWNEP